MSNIEHKEPVFDHNNEVKSFDPFPMIMSSTPQKRRKKEKKVNDSFASYWFNLIFLFIIGFSLLGIDFTLYTATKSGNIFNNFPVLQPEIIISLAAIAIVTLLIYFFLSGFTVLLCILTGGIGFAVFYAFLNQFADFSTLATIGYSSVYIAGAAAILIFVLLFFSNTKFRFFFAFLSLAIFGAVGYYCNRSLPDFSVDNYSAPSAQNESNRKIVNIMLPNLPSYAYLSTLDDQNTNKYYRDQLVSVMMGFYAKYNFKLFTNSFTKSGNPNQNAADSLNLQLPEDIYANLQNKLIKTNRWNFEQHNNFDTYLQHYKLLDILREQGYNINAYQSTGINLCQQNNQIVVNRCVTQNTFPSFKKYAQNVSPVENSIILLIKWLESTKWLDNFNKTIYNNINGLFSADNLPIIGKSFNNLHVVNSIETLNKLFTDITQDQGNNAYFAVIDFPSDMYLFDNMCNLKDMQSWQVKNNQPWVKQHNSMEKRSAYFQQTMCLYGKLGQFMEKLKNTGELKKTTVIIQGLIGIDDDYENESLTNRFLNTQMSPLAIYTPENKSFSINKSICSTPSLINQFFTGEKCVNFNGTNIAKSTRKEIIQNINNVVYTADKIQQYYKEYNEWFRPWNEQNYQSSAPVTSPSTEPQDEPEIIRPKAKLIPLEEKTITKQKITQKTVSTAPEANLESISSAAQKTPLIEEENIDKQ